MNSVFVVQHLHTLPGGEDDVKMIGVYRSLESARAAVERVKCKKGFRDYPRVIDSEVDGDDQGFHIDKYTLDSDHWSEGFTSWSEALRSQ